MKKTFIFTLLFLLSGLNLQKKSRHIAMTTSNNIPKNYFPPRELERERLEDDELEELEDEREVEVP